MARATTLLRAAEVDSPEVSALQLAEHVVGARPVLLTADVPDDFELRYFRLVGRRAGGVPVQLLLGTAPFRHLSVPVADGVFIPRPETELVAGAAISAALPLPAPVVVDLCTGTGAIALAVAQEVPAARVVAVDASAAAVELARANAARLRLGVDVRRGDVTDPALLCELAGSVDVVVANPPYVPAGVTLPAEVFEHDPAAALWGGGADGLDLPRAVVVAASRLLQPAGTLVMEHDETQGDALREHAAGAGFTDVHTHPDLTGRDRYLTARRNAGPN